VSCREGPGHRQLQEIYLRTRDCAYVYHPEDHSPEYYPSETLSNELRIGYDRELGFDAAVSYVPARASAAKVVPKDFQRRRFMARRSGAPTKLRGTRRRGAMSKPVCEIIAGANVTGGVKKTAPRSAVINSS